MNRLRNLGILLCRIIFFGFDPREGDETWQQPPLDAYVVWILGAIYVQKHFMRTNAIDLLPFARCLCCVLRSKIVKSYTFSRMRTSLRNAAVCTYWMVKQNFHLYFIGAGMAIKCSLAAHSVMTLSVGRICL